MEENPTDVLTREEIIQNKIRIENLLKSTEREGIDKVIKFLNESGYFFLYGSFKHHTYKGGLALHSLGVLERSLRNNVSCDRNSIIIASLLHDICKTKHEEIDGNPDEYHGHGRKSVKIIENFIGFQLTDDERLAIQYHMHRSTNAPREAGFRNKVENKECELHRLIHVSDCEDAGGYGEDSGLVLRAIMDTFNL